MLNRVATLASDGRPQTPQPEPTTPRHRRSPPTRSSPTTSPAPATPHGWTQVETSDRLEPFLGYKLNQAGVSAIEKTYDTERRRNIDAAEVVAFSRCFRRPIGWFFLPPPGHGGDLVEPVYERSAATTSPPPTSSPSPSARRRLAATSSTASPSCSRPTASSPPTPSTTPSRADHGNAEIEDQINLRRQADPRHHPRPPRRRRRRRHHPDGRSCSSKLVKLTPPGMANLRAHRPRPRPRCSSRKARPSSPPASPMAQRDREPASQQRAARSTTSKRSTSKPSSTRRDTRRRS